MFNRKGKYVKESGKSHKEIIRKKWNEMGKPLIGRGRDSLSHKMKIWVR